MMNAKKINWQILAGFVLSAFAMISYPLIFAAWPITRDLPWANFVLFAVAAVLLILGIRRGFRAGGGLASKIGAASLSLVSVAIFALFIFIAFIGAKWLPSSEAAPQVGQKSPDISLSDVNGKQVTLNELLSTPISTPNGDVPVRGVLLIFYRGYW
jgi:hypothetical protein